MICHHYAGDGTVATMTDGIHFVHYAAEPFDPATLRSIPQQPSEWFGDKPRGLWFSVDGKGDDWREWCLSTIGAAERVAHAHEIALRDEARILWIVDADGIDSFTTDYGTPGTVGPANSPTIDWPRVAQRFQGIIIAPYVWERRLTMHTMWYYGWDCASGCVWDAAAVASIALREAAR